MVELKYKQVFDVSDLSTMEEKIAVQRKKTQSAKTRNPLSLQLTQCAMRAAIEQKSLDVCGLYVGPVNDIADYFVIASGTSQRHVAGVAEKIKHSLRELGEEPVSASGSDAGEWVLLDYGNLVVHVFYEPTRQYYNIDGLLEGAERVSLDSELEEQAKKLRTGIYR